MTNVAAPQNRGQFRALLHLLFGWIEEPRVKRVLYFLTYIVAGFGAYVALVDPPRTVEGAIGPALMAAIGVFLAIGSLFASVGVLPGWWWLERAGAILILIGGIGYALIVISLSLSETEDLNRGLQLVFILIAILLLTGRVYDIRGVDLDPKV